MRCLTYADLRARGIPFSRQWLSILIKKGEFPAPIKLGQRSIVFNADEIDEWLNGRAALRSQNSRL